MAVMGSPASSACMFLGGSGILDKAVSCLRPWREVITGATSTGLTGRLGGNFEVSGATAPRRLQRAIPPHPASLPVDCFLSRPCTKFHLDSRPILPPVSSCTCFTLSGVISGNICCTLSCHSCLVMCNRIC